jgi:hypothetical protein
VPIFSENLHNNVGDTTKVVDKRKQYFRTRGMTQTPNPIQPRSTAGPEEGIARRTPQGTKEPKEFSARLAIMNPTRVTIHPLSAAYNQN